jgi:hypothetical protein
VLARRNRDMLPQKTDVTPFSDKAKDLGALRDAVVDAARVGDGLWISYIFTLFYFAIADGVVVTNRDLFLENLVTLPFLKVELPLKAFVILGQSVFMIVHTMFYCTSYCWPARSGPFIPNCRRRSTVMMCGCGCAASCRVTSSCNRLPGRARFELASSAFCSGGSSRSASSPARLLY